MSYHPASRRVRRAAGFTRRKDVPLDPYCTPSEYEPGECVVAMFAHEAHLAAIESGPVEANQEIE